MRAEDSCFDRNPFGAQHVGKALNEWGSDIRQRSIDERRPPTFARIGIQRELRYYQCRTAHILNRQVKLAVRILKHTQPHNFLSEPLRLDFAIAMPDTH